MAKRRKSRAWFDGKPDKSTAKLTRAAVRALDSGIKSKAKRRHQYTESPRQYSAGEWKAAGIFFLIGIAAMLILAALL